MITADQKAWLAMMGSDQLREYRDAIIEILAERNVASDNVVRSNVLIELEHRSHLGREGDPGEYTLLKEFVLHPKEAGRADGVMINRDGTRDHVWVEARWL